MFQSQEQLFRDLDIELFFTKVEIKADLLKQKTSLNRNVVRNQLKAEESSLRWKFIYRGAPYQLANAQNKHPKFL
jgi:hypothetical protein